MLLVTCQVSGAMAHGGVTGAYLARHAPAFVQHGFRQSSAGGHSIRGSHPSFCWRGTAERVDGPRSSRLQIARKNSHQAKRAASHVLSDWCDEPFIKQ